MIQTSTVMAVSESDTASKAQGLFETVQQGTVALSSVCFGDNKGVAGFEYLPPELNTLGGMFSALACVKESFGKKKKKQFSGSLLTVKATRMCWKLLLTPVASPCTHIPPQCFTGTHTYTSSSDY